MMETTSADGSITISEFVQLARKAVGPGSKKDTPGRILKHCESGSGIFSVILCDEERAEIRMEAELQIAEDQFRQAKKRLYKAELAAELAAGRKAREIAG